MLVGNAFCEKGSMQQEGKSCGNNSVIPCPTADPSKVRLPCKNANGNVVCSNEVSATNVCKGKLDDKHCPE